MVTVSIHQPHFLPWLNYFNKVARADIFIWLDDVQFRRRYFQNRAKIKVQNKEFWLAVETNKSELSTKINNIEIINKSLIKITKTIQINYSKAPYFNEYSDDIFRILSTKYQYLSDLNFDLFMYLINILEIKTKIVKSSDIDVGEVANPNERLIKLCSYFNATHYIAGKGGKNYMDLELFKQHNIDIQWQEFPNKNIVYNQVNGDFIAGLSVIDVLFNIGAAQTRQLIFTEWQS